MFAIGLHECSSAFLEKMLKEKEECKNWFGWFSLDAGSVVFIPSDYLVWDTAETQSVGLRIAIVTEGAKATSTSTTTQFGSHWREVAAYKAMVAVADALKD